VLVELEAVGYTYLPRSEAAAQALADVSLTVGSGEFIALIGPTGSGKSTLVQIMAGLVKPTVGRVKFEGEDIWLEKARLPERRRLVGLVFQEPEKQLFEMTVEDDVAFWPRNAGVSAEAVPEMTRAALEAVGLDYASYRARSPFTLSGGEMRRAAIAGIVVMNPRVLILDEPTVGLDARGRMDLSSRIRALNQNETAIVMVSHDMDEVAESADRVIMLAQGSIVFDGPPREAFKQTDLLAGIDLEPPQVARIAASLHRQGLLGGRLPLTLAEIESDILTAFGKAPE